MIHFVVSSSWWATPVQLPALLFSCYGKLCIRRDAVVCFFTACSLDCEAQPPNLLFIAQVVCALASSGYQRQGTACAAAEDDIFY